MNPHTKGMLAGTAIGLVIILCCGFGSLFISKITGLDYQYLFVASLVLALLVVLLLSRKKL